MKGIFTNRTLDQTPRIPADNGDGGLCLVLRWK